MSIASVFAYSAQSFEETNLSFVFPLLPTVFVVGDGLEFLEFAVRASGWQMEMFASAEAFLARPRFLGPSCLVLDITRPDHEGIGLQKHFTADRTHMPIILTTGGGNVLMTVQAMISGSLNLVATAAEGEGLPSAIRFAIERSEMALRYEQHIQALRARHDSLSGRERQVMMLVTAGLLNKQVGRELGISEITVKAHRGRVMRKMKAGSLAGLVTMVANLHLTGSRQAASHTGRYLSPV